MTLQEAIEISTHISQIKALSSRPDEEKAVKLGIEALKRIQAIRPYSNKDHSYYLQGETKE